MILPSTIQAEAYKRIVSLTPSITDNIYYLEAQSQLVGCTSYCKLGVVDKKEIVATAVKPNIEKIISLKPDLVLTSGLTDERDIATLRKVGIRVEVFNSPRSFESICEQFLQLGKLTGHEEIAHRIVKESEKSVEIIKKQGNSLSPKPKVFIQVSAAPIYSVIPNTFMNDLIEYCGGVNIGARLKKAHVGREFVVASNPDYIFVVTMGLAGNHELELWKQFKEMNAIKQKHLYLLDADQACQPSPVAFVQTLQEINQYILSK